MPTSVKLPADGADVAVQAYADGSVAEVIRVDIGAGSTPSFVSGSNPMPVAGPLTDAQMRAAPIPVSNSVLSDILAKIISAPATEASQAAILAALQAGSALGASEVHIGRVTGSNSASSATVTRPADTTAYSALDVIANSVGLPAVITFPSIARVAGGSAYIVKAVLSTDQSACLARLRLHLFHTSPTAMADNAPYTALWANAANYVGYLDFPALATEGAGSTCAMSVNSNARLLFSCDAGSTAIYGIAETLDSFTPASAQNFRFDLMTDNS